LNKLQTLYPAKEYVTFRQLLDEIVARFSENNAFIVKKDKSKNEYTNITYKRFYGEVECMGTAFMSRFGKNARIAIISENRYEWMVAHFAALLGAGLSVPLDKGLSKAEIASPLSKYTTKAETALQETLDKLLAED